MSKVVINKGKLIHRLRTWLIQSFKKRLTWSKGITLCIKYTLEYMPRSHETDWIVIYNYTLPHAFFFRVSSTLVIHVQRRWVYLFLVTIECVRLISKLTLKSRISLSATERSLTRRCNFVLVDILFCRFTSAHILRTIKAFINYAWFTTQVTIRTRRFWSLLEIEYFFVITITGLQFESSLLLEYLLLC